MALLQIIINFFNKIIKRYKLIVQLLQQMYQLKLKINITKHQKNNTWDQSQTYFIDQPLKSKRTRRSPPSLRQDKNSNDNNKQKRNSSIKKNSNTSKISMMKKTSSNKYKQIQPSLQKISVSKLKKPKKKTLIEQTNLADYQGLRGSLPGLSGKKVIQKFQPLLSQNQRIQLINQKTVYYIGISSTTGQDDLQGRYIWRKHQQVGFRYELLQSLGRGAFGEVIQAYDHKNKQIVAVKIIKAGRQQMQLALNQINILMKIKQNDIDNKKNVLRIKDFIVFRRHICIITQLLSNSLYQLLQANYFRPLDSHNIKAFAIQLLFSLAFLKQLGVVHSDIKPQNVGIKLIDFGTSMFLHQTNYSYIQSRFYRAPQVILGYKYDTAIDMWSFGCLIAQLSTGSPIFAGQNQQQQFSLIMRTTGIPNSQFLSQCRHLSKYFNKDYSPKIIKGKDGKALLPGSRPLYQLIQDTQLCRFLQKILRIQPRYRLTPLQALAQPWILSYFPQQMRKQHLNDILLKIKKQQGNNQKQYKTSTAVKGHRKRNSQLHSSVSKNHKRRGSEGLF